MCIPLLFPGESVTSRPRDIHQEVRSSRPTRHPFPIWPSHTTNPTPLASFLPQSPQKHPLPSTSIPIIPPPTTNPPPNPRRRTPPNTPPILISPSAWPATSPTSPIPAPTRSRSRSRSRPSPTPSPFTTPARPSIHPGRPPAVASKRYGWCRIRAWALRGGYQGCGCSGRCCCCGGGVCVRGGSRSRPGRRTGRRAGAGAAGT